MSNNNNTVSKVKRATLDLGDVQLEVFQLPDGSYRLSQTQTGVAVEKPDNSVLRFLKSNSPQAIPHQGFQPYKASVLGQENLKVNLLPLEVATSYWLKEALAGNQLAASTLAALAVDSLTRRADAAFGVVRSEEEYNAQVKKIREAGKQSRSKFTQAVRNYIARNNIQGNQAKFLTANVSNLCYQLLFGKDANALKAERKVSNIRDDLPLTEVTSLKQLENAAAHLIGKNVDPVKAVKYAFQFIQCLNN